jgi:hypothetical protein
LVNVKRSDGRDGQRVFSIKTKSEDEEEIRLTAETEVKAKAA